MLYRPEEYYGELSVVRGQIVVSGQYARLIWWTSMVYSVWWNLGRSGKSRLPGIRSQHPEYISIGVIRYESTATAKQTRRLLIDSALRSVWLVAVEGCQSCVAETGTAGGAATTRTGVSAPGCGPAKALTEEAVGFFGVHSASDASCMRPLISISCARSRDTLMRIGILSCILVMSEAAMAVLGDRCVCAVSAS
ncbi:hypothetical protein IF2G_06239 [Cordyceps javanica]|nr:hypothetical protein IF2G_06239 [Cordyceps javanica]